MKPQINLTVICTDSQLMETIKKTLNKWNYPNSQQYFFTHDFRGDNLVSGDETKRIIIVFNENSGLKRFDSLSTIRKSFKSLGIICITASLVEDVILEYIACGAKAIVHTSQIEIELINKIEVLMKHKVALDTQQIDSLLEYFRQVD